MHRWLILAIVAVVVVFALMMRGGGSETESAPPPRRQAQPTAAPASGVIVLNPASYGASWPFTVDSVKLQCRGKDQVVVIADQVYGVNTTAKSRNGGNYPDVVSITKGLPDQKKTLESIIDKGLTLCV